jgi:hypothetical protein
VSRIESLFPLPGFEAKTALPVASRNTAYAIPAILPILKNPTFVFAVNMNNSVEINKDIQKSPSV